MSSSGLSSGASSVTRNLNTYNKVAKNKRNLDLYNKAAKSGRNLTTDTRLLRMEGLTTYHRVAKNRSRIRYKVMMLDSEI